MKRILLPFFLSLSIILISAHPAISQKNKGPVEVIILHVNDMHAKIDNMAKLAYFADSLRKIHPYVYLFAAGDNFTGNPVVDMVDDKGYPMIDLMNQCGFTLSTMGNHEFDLGQEAFNRRQKQADFPFISCNIDASGAVLKQPKPFYILKAGIVKIPVLGIIQLGENGMPDSHPSRLTGVKFTDGIAKAGEYKYLKDKYGMLIALTHLGVEGDEPLAKAMPQFDLIIGGHSHTTITTPMVVNGVKIVQTGSGLKNVGMTTLTVDRKKITDIKYQLIPLASVKSTNASVQAAVDKYNDNQELNRTISRAESDFTGENALGGLMTDAVTNIHGVDISFQNTGGIRIGSIPKGDIKLKDVYRLDPFGNEVIVFKMNVAEIQSLICNAFNRNKDVDLIPSGVKYTILTDQNGLCTAVNLTDTKGNTLDPNKEYTVGVNSYIAASYKFDHRDAGASQYKTTAQTLIEYLIKVKNVAYDGVPRTGVKPEK
ncbi:MAG TPA: bifunctional UDP-sugar hydrolase/5'-nucleotidase [Bacteroidales bacterium]|nr:bifunctional UDP-sugar hydrolase/5'-nucleotidase [Bacteroidales bacterium]